MADIIKQDNSLSNTEEHIPQVGDYYTERDGLIVITDIKVVQTSDGRSFTRYEYADIDENFQPCGKSTMSDDSLKQYHKYLPNAKEYWDEAEKLIKGELKIDMADTNEDYSAVNTYAVTEGGNLKLLMSQKRSLQEVEDRTKNILAAARAKIATIQNRMEHERRKLEKYKCEVSKQIGRINNVLGLLDLYTTDKNDVNHIKVGKNASDEEPLYIRQLTLYMDEECAISDNDGVDANDIPKFTEWLLSDQKHIDQIVPEQKVVVAIKPRRAPAKDYGSEVYNRMVEQWNKYTYFLFRNGENLYYIDSGDFQVGGNLIPTKKEMENVQKEAADAEKWGRSAQEVYEHFNLQYYRFMMFLQGIIVNTDILDPIPKSINMLDEKTYTDNIRVVYDADDLLGDGHISYEKWKALNRASVGVGSRILYVSKLYNSWSSNVSRHECWGNDHLLRYYNGNYRIPNPPDTGVYELKSVFVEWEKSKYVPTGEGKGKYLGFLYKARRDFDYEEKKRNRVTCMLNDDDMYLNYDMLSLEDIEYYLNTRLYRKQYLEIMPILIKARNDLRKEKVEEVAFRNLLINQSSKPLTPEVVDEAITWWKMKNKYKRPISKDCAKAMRMIKQKLGVK